MFDEKKRLFGKTPEVSNEKLRGVFAKLDYVIIALLFGSRVSGRVGPQSDYDFAVLINELPEENWGMESRLRKDIALSTSLKDCDFDIVDLKEIDKLILDSIQKGYVILKGSENEIQGLFSKKHEAR